MRYHRTRASRHWCTAHRAKESAADWPVSLKSNRKFWDSCFSARRLYNFMSSPTVGKGGRRNDASFCGAAIVRMNTGKNNHTHSRWGKTMTDMFSEQQSCSDSMRFVYFPFTSRVLPDGNENRHFIYLASKWMAKIKTQYAGQPGLNLWLPV